MVSINIDNTRISNVKGSVFSTWMSSLGASSNVCDRVNKHMYEWFKYLCVYIINIHILTLPLYVHAGLHRVCKYIWMEVSETVPGVGFYLSGRTFWVWMQEGRADVSPSSPPLSEPAPLLSPTSSWNETTTPTSCFCSALWPEWLETLRSHETNVHWFIKNSSISMT